MPHSLLGNFKYIVSLCLRNNTGIEIKSVLQTEKLKSKSGVVIFQVHPVRIQAQVYTPAWKVYLLSPGSSHFMFLRMKMLI